MSRQVLFKVQCNGWKKALQTIANNDLLYITTNYKLPGDDEILELLLHNGMDPDTTNSAGQTPLHVAVSRHHVRVYPDLNL